MEQALVSLGNIIDPRQVFGILVSTIVAEQDDQDRANVAIVRASIRMLACLVSRMSPALLLGNIGR